MGDRPLPTDSFADIAVALRIEANRYAGSDQNLEVLLAYLGLSDSATIIAAERRHTRLIVSGHYLFKAMCEHEAEIRTFLASLQAKRASRQIREVVG
jgi:hypothetical protein